MSHNSRLRRSSLVCSLSSPFHRFLYQPEEPAVPLVPPHQPPAPPAAACALAVPYRGQPKYSTRRRAQNGAQILRRRSLSQSSVCSAQSERCYQTPQSVRLPPGHQLSSPAPSRLSFSQPGSEYGTLRRYPADAVQHQVAGFE